MKRTWADRFRGEPAAVAALAVFVLSSATLSGAWYFQHVLKILPCPLCLEQRISYYVVIPLSLLIAIAAMMRAPPKLLIVGFIAIIVAGLGNAVLGTYHAGVEWHFWADTGPFAGITLFGPAILQTCPFSNGSANFEKSFWLGRFQERNSRAPIKSSKEIEQVSSGRGLMSRWRWPLW
jgi:disulfide bond formation protein DsbB